MEQYEQVLASDAALIGDAQKRWPRWCAQTATAFWCSTSSAFARTRWCACLWKRLSRACWPTAVPCPSAGRTASCALWPQSCPPRAGGTTALPAVPLHPFPLRRSPKTGGALPRLSMKRSWTPAAHSPVCTTPRPGARCSSQAQGAMCSRCSRIVPTTTTRGTWSNTIPNTCGSWTALPS